MGLIVPHRATVFQPKQVVVNGVLVNQGYAATGATIRCNIQPKTSDSAFRDFNIENEEVSDLFAPLRFAKLLIDGAKVKFNGVDYVVRGNGMVYQQGLPNDHVKCALVRVRKS